MLGVSCIELLGLVEGRKTSAVIVEALGISKPSGLKRPSSIAKAKANSLEHGKYQLQKSGFSKEQIDDWEKNSPTMPCASIIYGTQRDGLQFPYTLEYARSIDEATVSAFDAGLNEDLKEFKTIISSHFNKQGWLTNCPHLHYSLGRFDDANDWGELDLPFRELAGYMQVSLFALLDVEFCSYSVRFEPRSLFAMLLPRLDASISKDQEIEITKRRGMYHLPVRRLIEMIACVGEFDRKKRWPDAIPTIKQIAIDADQPEQNLINWRDGTKKFTRHHFWGIWERLCPIHETPEGKKYRPDPMPLYLAAIQWQKMFVRSDSGINKIISFETEYQHFWDMAYEHLKAKGLMFGAAPWPSCFTKI